jgi:transcription initiation factor TFIID TATA-box-binding protein
MGSGSIDRELDLEAIINGLENYLSTSIDANFTSNGMATIRLEEDGPAYTLYRTGNFQIRGTTDKEHLNESADRFQKVLSEIDVDIPTYEFNHATSVFMEDIGQEVNLETLAIALGMEDTEYEPEQFPGLIYRPAEFEVTLLVFASGKIIFAGTTDRTEATSALDQLVKNVSKVSTN